MTKLDKLIDASPTKNFFISALVKDIQLLDAILDLIDNSIDGYIENRLKDKRKISLNISNNKFIIEDNCGGIKKENIYDKVFRFGKPSEEKIKTIGVFGIGLKRAIFKMGQNILIESDDGNDFYSIVIDKEWIKDEKNWNLKFEKEEGSKGIPLTRITVTELFPNISRELDTQPFINKLIDRIKETYTNYLKNKIEIEINGDIIKPFSFKLLYDEAKHFKPLHKKMKIEDVEVEIYAGFTSKSQEEDHYGWYVFCNDRLILLRDTSDKTGWGNWYSEGTRYHYPEDNRFLGLIFFSSDNPLSLPWHTTKEDIQEDSELYKKAQIEMKEITTNFVKLIGLAGRTKDPETNETIGKSLFENVAEVLIDNIAEEMKEIFPDIKGQEYSTTRIIETTSIQFMAKKKIVKRIKENMDNPHMPNKKMGEELLEYYVNMEEIDCE